jgi:hypothetical protein
MRHSVGHILMFKAVSGVPMKAIVAGVSMYL